MKVQQKATLGVPLLPKIFRIRAGHRAKTWLRRQNLSNHVKPKMSSVAMTTMIVAGFYHAIKKKFLVLWLQIFVRTDEYPLPWPLVLER